MPPHRLATEDDLRRLPPRCTPRILPALRLNDPIVQYLGLRVGNVVRIDRKDGSTYFRVVVASTGRLH